MDPPNSMVFPSAGMHALSATIHLLGVSILAHIISRRTILRGSSTLKDISWLRICILFIFIDSWLFIFGAGILVLGSGLERNSTSCSMGIFLCILFYGSSKFLIYAFLSERVYVVWRAGPQTGRLQCKTYIGCIVALSGYIGVVCVLFYGRISYFAGDRLECHIGLKKMASIALLTYDFFVNAFLTGLFLWPVLRSSFQNSRIKRLAMRTLWSALIALTTSCVNILILTLMQGRQLGWVCLGSCGTDVIVNALVIFWVTSSYPDNLDRMPTSQDFVSPSKSEDVGPVLTDPQRNSKVLFKVGRSKKESSVGVTNMQIAVTTERIQERSELSINESEYELQKVHSVPRVSLNGTPENYFPDSHK